LSFLGGATGRSSQLATKTLDLLESGAHESDTRYWLGATRAEALLLLGREIEARAALRDAVAGTPMAWEDHAVTLRQFRLILSEQGRPDDWLDQFRPPAAIHFAGPIGIDPQDARLEAAIEAAVAGIRPGSATGALAAGFDIVAAEILHRHGVRLHLILPSSVDDFVMASVLPHGADWRPRFERLIAEAESVEILDEPAGLCAGAVVMAEEMALGLTVREARLRGSDAILLRMKGAAPDHPSTGGEGLRIVEVAGTGLVQQGALVRLGLPARPVAILGCGSGTLERLAQRALRTTHITGSGGFVLFDDLAEAAEIATELFDGDEGTTIVLDFGIAEAGGSGDFARLENLLALRPHGFPLASRPAALALDALGAPFRTAIAGESASLDEAVEFFSLWGTS
jgi:hypothetical protein